MNPEKQNSQLRVLVVDSSAFMRTAIAKMISTDPGLRVAGTASTGLEALQRIPELDPDLITLDIQMPTGDGLLTLQRIMAKFPRPVIVVSALSQRDSEVTLNAFEAGACDYVAKRISSASLDIMHIREDLIGKIHAAAKTRAQLPAEVIAPRKPPLPQKKVLRAADSTLSIVAIGVSTGGPKALQDILPTLPADLPVPIVIVQHMPLGFTGPLAQRLNSLSSVSIREAAQGDILQPGVVYIAPSGLQLRVDRIGSRSIISLSQSPQGQMHSPSVDLMMQSVAVAFGSSAMGVIMTGMGSDGAAGMDSIHQAGGFTLGQDEGTCAVYGMPRVCAEMRILDRIVPLSQIPKEILQAIRYAKRA